MPPLRIQILIALVTFLAFVLVVPAADAWLRTLPRPVQTSAHVIVRCPSAEHGALLVATIRSVDGRLVAGDCIEIVSRGQHARERRW